MRSGRMSRSAIDRRSVSVKSAAPWGTRANGLSRRWLARLSDRFRFRQRRSAQKPRLRPGREGRLPARLAGRPYAAFAAARCRRQERYAAEQVGLWPTPYRRDGDGAGCRAGHLGFTGLGKPPRPVANNAHHDGRPDGRCSAVHRDRIGR
jgi:hypothetical protein